MSTAGRTRNLSSGTWLAAAGLSCLLAGRTAAVAASGPTCVTQSRVVEAAIGAVARKLRGREYCQFRRYETLSDVDGDGTDDLIVLYTIEGIGGGGDDHADFMSVFLSGRRWRPLTAQTGRRGTRDPDSIAVQQRRIVLHTLVYRPEDPMCCPSGQGSLTYEVRGNALHLVGERAEPAAAAAPPTATPAQ